MKKKGYKKIGAWIFCFMILAGYFSTAVYAVENTDKREEELSEGMVSGNIIKSEEKAVSENYGEIFSEKQYHFEEENLESVKKWVEMYCPNGFEELQSYDETWWNNLYDYEKDYAEFLINLSEDLSEDIYSGQSLQESIAVLENGVDADDFFQGTIFQGLTLEELREFSDFGYAMEDIEEMLFGISSYALADGDLAAKVSVSPTGYVGSEHGMIYKIVLGGQPALCFSHGKACRSSFLYNANSGTYEKKTSPLGYFVNHASVSGADYVACQIAAWLYLESDSFTQVKVKSRSLMMLNVESEVYAMRMLNTIWDYYSEAKSHPSEYYTFHSDNGNAQALGVSRMPATIVYQGAAAPEVPDVPGGDTVSKEVSVSYKIQLHKRDWQTGVGLSGCAVELFEDGEYLTTVTTNGEGYAEYSVTKTETLSVSYDGISVTKEQAEAELAQKEEEFKAKEYTYSTDEITAPVGYVWEANHKEQTIAGGETAEFELTNERTLGAVELVKYDTESECGTRQGDAVLDGAIYGIYAAEDIVHQDKKTGVLFKKDTLVKTAEVGKTPKRNADGYILNTDGSRHIANAGGVIAYENTPGKTLFGDLELGSYYIKEITPSEGYMLDEAVYKATFTYKWQMTKIEERNEQAKEAVNELTADDESTSHSIYSGDYVIKQGIQFIKTSDNTYQTELTPIEGAGFCIYLISDLTDVKDGSITPLGEHFTADDIMTFYEYDFTPEKTATVYKRTDHEEWIEGDKLWLEAGEKLNEYHVKEMFTDADGRICTPELPYGTYVVVETTTPEHHVCAKPFIVYITKDGGVLYTDETKQTSEKTYTSEEGIRYGDHKETKNREGRVLQKQRIINNTITKSFLRILKADKEFTVVPGTYIEAEEFVRGTVLKEGAEYRLRCLTMELSEESLIALNWKYDSQGYLSYYDPNAKQLTGTAEHPFTTSFLRRDKVIKDCYITLPQEIPIGTYELTELTAPEGYVVNGSEQEISDIGTGRVNGYEVLEAPFPKLVFTINNGAVYPDGQMGTNKYALRDAYGNLTVTVLQENQEQKGVIEIYKHGEQLAGAHEDNMTLLEKLEAELFRMIRKAEEAQHRDLIFEYEDAPIEGAGFDIIAAEDIYTQELQKDLFENYEVSPEDYLIHRKGDIVAAITTDKNGWGYAAGLYIGKYKIVETTAGNGFVLNTKETEFEITPQEQTVNFDFHTADYRNERQKLEITVKKQDAESEKELEGAIYGLYAEEDIKTAIFLEEESGKWKVRDEQEVLYPAGTLLATCITDEQGQAAFEEDIPLGKYVIRELEGPVGYLTASEDISVDGSYESQKGGQTVEKQEYEVLFQNKETEALISKQDITSKEELAGALLEIKEIKTDEHGNLKKDGTGEYVTETVTSWISGEEPNIIRGLQLDRVYILSERIAPEGYGYAEEILFKLVQEKEDGKLTDIAGLYSQDGENWSRASEDVLVMYDEKQGLSVEKSTISMTQRGDNYQYSIDEIRNLTEETLEHFTLTDKLPPEIYLTELWTGTYNEKLLYDVEYKTNQSSEWLLWESGLSTEENHHLLVPDEFLSEKKHISQFRICFGTVGGGFSKVETPVYYTTVLPDAAKVILNEIELTAEQNGRILRDRDETETILYFKRLAGYGAKGGADPLYEVVDMEGEEPEEVTSLIRKIIEEAEWREVMPENLSEQKTIYDVPRTGDGNQIIIWVLLSALSAAGIIFWSIRKKRKNIE